MQAMKLPVDWKRELFASEPAVANIVAFDIDHQGRVYVCETFRQNRGVTDNRAHDEQWLLADLAAKTVQDRIDYHKRLLGDAAITYAQQDDRIRRLQDTNGDGVADESIVVADGFNRLEDGTGAGVLARGKDVYYTCIPKLWKLIDADGDGKADERVVLSDGYGVRVAFRGHDMHGLIIGPDGRLYFSIGDRGHYVTRADGSVLSDPSSGSVFRCELDGSKLEVVCQRHAKSTGARV
jgi:quinoprotein glucose dehydrogenase